MTSCLYRFLFLAVMGLTLTSCASTMSIKTEGSSSATLDKGALHYIIAPRASDPIEMRNLYPIVVDAFKQNHIALTTSRKAAVYTVTWGSDQTMTQVKTLQGSPYGWGEGALNTNSIDGGWNPAYGQPATGPEFYPGTRPVKVHTFMVTVWKKEGPDNAQPVKVWTGNAEIKSHDAKDTAAVIDQIVARYGTNFEGQTQLK